MRAKTTTMERRQSVIVMKRFLASGGQGLHSYWALREWLGLHWEQRAPS